MNLTPWNHLSNLGPNAMALGIRYLRPADPLTPVPLDPVLILLQDAIRESTGSTSPFSSWVLGVLNGIPSEVPDQGMNGTYFNGLHDIEYDPKAPRGYERMLPFTNKAAFTLRPEMPAPWISWDPLAGEWTGFRAPADRPHPRFISRNWIGVKS